MCDFCSTMKIVAVESDNFLETSPNMEYFCRDSCCHQVEHVSHPLDLVNGVLNEQWIPTESKTLISNSFFNLHINIWLLEGYVLIMKGKLGPKLVGHDQNALEPFPALKMLYLVSFGCKTANSDPRANGKDSSVGIVELPGSCCRNLAEILTASSSELPPVYQSMAQFSVIAEILFIYIIYRKLETPDL
uniref:E3 ubiquitin-protein ligase E3D n=1 Tax=Syphacia muris TaxID=451379 RepID=A0A0N5AH64_9BILA